MENKNGICVCVSVVLFGFESPLGHDCKRRQLTCAQSAQAVKLGVVGGGEGCVRWVRGRPSFFLWARPMAMMRGCGLTFLPSGVSKLCDVDGDVNEGVLVISCG